MKNFYIAITFLCAALIAFLVLIACALTDKPEEPQAVAPEINADGLCIVTVVKAPDRNTKCTSPRPTLSLSPECCTARRGAARWTIR